MLFDLLSCLRTRCTSAATSPAHSGSAWFHGAPRRATGTALSPFLRQALIGLACLLPWASQAHWTLGSFETGVQNLPPPAPWIYTPFYNSSAGVTLTEPMTRANLNLSLPPNGQPVPGSTAVLRPPLQDPWVLISQNTPWGGNAAVINLGGSNHSVNQLSQTATMESSDVDPADGLIHVRLALLPMLEVSNHQPEQQPYVYVEVRNVTRGDSRVFSQFISLDQPGILWQQDGQGKYAYSNWQAFDIAPGQNAVQVGDQLTLTVIVAGCSLGSHEAHAYLTGVGSFFPPGLNAQARAPQAVLPDTDLNYTLHYSNTGNQTFNFLQLVAHTPADTVLNSFVAPPGATCTSPLPGATGEIQCTLASFSPGATADLALSVRVGAAAASSRSQFINAQYGFRNTGLAAMWGPSLATQILDPSRSQSVSVQKSGSGTGEIGLSPNGLSCGSSCDQFSLSLNNGSSLQMHAGADANSYFAGWSGACTGTADCRLTMMGNALQAQASFVLRPVATASSSEVSVQSGQAVQLTPVSTSGGSQPLSFTISPALPSGLSLDSSTGQISGTAGTAQSGNYTITVQDALQYTATATFKLNIANRLQSQSLRLGTAPALGVGGTAAIDVRASSGLAVSLRSLTPDTCSVSGLTARGLALGTCTLEASQGGDPVYAAATPQSLSLQVTNRSYSGSPPGIAGSVGAGFTGGGGSATLTRARFIAVSGDVGSPTAAAPAGVSFPYGLFDMVISNVTTGGTAQLTLTYPQALPAGTRYWKYGKTSPTDTAHWYVFSGASVSGNTITLTLTDGGSGDDDGFADGAITDPGGPGIGGDDALAVPTLSNWALLGLAGLIGLAMLTEHRRRSTAVSPNSARLSSR